MGTLPYLRDGQLPPETRAFVLYKLRRCVKELRDTAKHLDERLKELP